MKPNPRRLDRNVYPFHFDLPVRSNDLDQQQHVNNVRLMEYYQEGRVLFHRALRDETGFDRAHIGRILVAHQSVDYLQEVRYPGIVTLGVGILKIGTSSYTIGAGLFQEGRCAGLGMAVMVNANQEGTVALPADFVAELKRKLLPAEAL